MTRYDEAQALLIVPINEWVVQQSIIFDWHDGPREGVSRLLNPDIVVYLRLFAESTDQDQSNIFAVSVLTIQAYTEIEVSLQVLGPLYQPAWIPRWHFASASHQQAVEEKVDALLTNAQNTRLLVRTHDMISFQEVWMKVSENRNYGLTE